MRGSPGAAPDGSRRMAEFVGRRAELRELLGAACRAGFVIHGVEGIGKTRLVAELLRRLAADQLGGRTVRLPGTATADDLMIALGDPQAVTETITLVVDDLATVPIPGGGGRGEPVDAGLAGFLAAWIREPGPRRLVITSRYPFALPGRAHRRLAELRLGPLLPADARRLMAALPGLARLPAEQQTRAWACCAGHPRALEYLDTLLCHGATGFAEVAERLEGVLAENGIREPAEWIHRGGPLAEAITATVDDVLMRDLLELRYDARRAGETAHRLGDPDEASGHQRRALAIDERLGRRAGPAGWDRLGLLAGEGDGDDPAELERELRQSLAADAERGNRAAMASGLHRLGLVCTLTGRLPAAVALHCRALATELALGSPGSPLELAELSRLRAALGDDEFRRAAAEVLPEQSMNGLTRMLDAFLTAGEHRCN
ncbi:ATP-binding protein [Actinoplanes sp. LDG1-06]|uniref:ATP-binding protein n=1 Tax=Paractinoplanes ovalisporus TaxID=2810368 RepID=A0ABS2ANE3_9ACTN|nr:ATP-binding protein [Actinoplanes ovalisporus]MBM2621339.1 ATP-binding protein [Actinoplanes ovalisporus]